MATFSPKVERYKRAAEYLELMKLTWASEQPFDFAGEFYRVKGASSDVRPLQQPHPLLFFGGASDGALENGRQTLRRLRHLRRAAEVHARAYRGLLAPRPRPSEGCRASTSRSARSSRRAEGEAWDRGEPDPAQMTGKKGLEPPGGARATGPVDKAGRAAADGVSPIRTIHDERLWMPIAPSPRARQRPACLFARRNRSPAILKYYVAGRGLLS
jgi:alkanesulfonate monooxygenase